MTEEEKRWIDNASYEDLLRKWRFAPSGNPMFQGDTGAHYLSVMSQKRAEVGNDEATRVSKLIGWDL